MARYIDIDPVHEEIEAIQRGLESNIDKIWYKNKPKYKALAIARRIMNDQPTADVAPVVRCKDCEHGQFMPSCSMYLCRCTGGKLRYAGDYCNYGERRKE